MEIAVTGSSGLIGSALVPLLREEGHRVRRLVRRPPRADDEVRWSPADGEVDVRGLAGIDAVVNLGGEPIGAGRWTKARKRRIRHSRVAGTTALAEAMTALEPRPTALLSASAIGFYGDRDDERLTEESPAGAGFLADVVAEWEAATAPAADQGIRTVLLRSGIVLSPAGGALRRQLPLFRLGVGGPLAGGSFWQSWISLDDEVAAICHLLTSDVAGPVNLAAPEPVTNAELTRTLGRVLRRPAVLPVPRFALDLVLGRELSRNLLVSQRVVPVRLEADGFLFRHATLEPALRHLLDRPGS